MTMDLLNETQVQSESGAISRSWTVVTLRIPCIARSIKGQGIRVVGSTERFGDTYENIEILKVQTAYRLSKRDRITNVLDSHGNLTWQENGVPIVFEVFGSIPIMDGFGTLIEYDIIANRAEVQ